MGHKRSIRHGPWAHYHEAEISSILSHMSPIFAYKLKNFRSLSPTRALSIHPKRPNLHLLGVLMASALLAPVASLHRLLSSSPPSLSNPKTPISIPVSTPRSLSTLAPSLANQNSHLPRPLVPKASDQEGALAVAVAVAVKEDEEDEKEDEARSNKERRRVYIGNLPFGLSASHLEALFSQCCPLGKIDMKVTRNEKGESNGWAFISVGSENDARSLIKKFDSYVLLDKTIKVEYPRRKTKLTSLPPPPVPKELSQNVYVSNLAWKARKGDLQEFFSNFKPVSVRVIFDSLLKRATGYGFIKFATKEEALAAIAELNGKELMGRPLRLKLKEKNEDTPVVEQEPAENSREPAAVS